MARAITMMRPSLAASPMTVTVCLCTSKGFTLLRSSTSRLLLLTAGVFAAFPAFSQTTSQSDWNLSLDAIMLSSPQYPGSNRDTTHFYPLVDGIYKDEFFFRSDSIPGVSMRGLGLYLFHADGFELTASLAPSFEDRENTNNAQVQKLGDVAPTMRAAFAASYKTNWWQVTGAITRDLNGEKKEGVTGGVDFAFTYHYSPALSFSAGPGFTYGNAEYTSTFFGVSAAQSQASGLAAYNTGGGIFNSHVRIGANYLFDKAWALGAFATTARLDGDVGNSPVIETKNQTSYGLYLARHF